MMRVRERRSASSCARTSVCKRSFSTARRAADPEGALEGVGRDGRVVQDSGDGDAVTNDWRNRTSRQPPPDREASVTIDVAARAREPVHDIERGIA